jgi:hypothetical protein
MRERRGGKGKGKGREVGTKGNEKGDGKEE